MDRPVPLDPRKPPRQRRSIATVETILEGAARILEERGLAGFNTNAVAERAGVSVGSLYQYFPGKDALLAALIRRDHAALREAVEAAVAAGPAGAPPALDQGLRALIGVAVRHQAARPRLARLLDLEERRLPLDAEAAAALEAIGGAIAGFLAHHAAALAVQDLAVATRDIVAIARALVDEDGGREVPDPAALEARVLRAVRGYLLLPG